jgi:hypothetical protein
MRLSTVPSFESPTALRARPPPEAHPPQEVRRVFHALRHHAIEHRNGRLKASFGCHGQVPTRGLRATRGFAPGAVFVARLAGVPPDRSARGVRWGLKPFLCAA